MSSALKNIKEDNLGFSDDLLSAYNAVNRVLSVFELLPTGELSKANENFLNLLGYDSINDLEGRHHRVLCEDDYVSSEEYTYFWSELRKGEPYLGKSIFKGSNGRKKWVHSTYSPISDDDGVVLKIIVFVSDISEITNTNSELKEKVIAISKVQAIIEFNLDGSVITANDNFLNTLNYELREIENKHHRMFCDDEFSDSVEYQLFWDKLRNGEYLSGEYKRLGKNGKEIWIQASYNPIFDMCGKPFKIVKYAIDITEDKLRLAEFEGKLNAISKSQAIIEFDLNGTVLTANDNFLDTLGYSLSEIMGVHHRIFCEDEYTSSSNYSAFWDKLNRGEFQSGEYKRIAKGGREVWIQASYNPIFDADGKPLKIVKFATNITGEKLKVDAISKSRAVIEFDLNGEVKFANDNFLKTVGYTLEEIKGKHHRIFCDKEYVESVDYEKFWSNLRKGNPNSGRFKRLGKEGNTIWLQATYNPDFDNKGDPCGVTKFGSDISKQVEVEDTVTKLSEDFRDSTKDISLKASDVSNGAQALGATTEEMSAS